MNRYEFLIEYKSAKHGMRTDFFAGYGDCEAEAEWQAIAYAENTLKKLKPGFTYEIKEPAHIKLKGHNFVY